MLHPLLCLCSVPSVATPATEPFRDVVVDSDNTIVKSNSVLAIRDGVIEDADGNGVIHIVGHGITVEFTSAPLVGAAPGTAPDRMKGIGIVVTGKNVTLRGARISGYRVGIEAKEATRLWIEDCHVLDGFRQHLGSTPKAEDPSDWLAPHDNDANEWVEKYGAAFCIEDSSQVTVSDSTARKVQNGLILDRVDKSLVYDNDFSFLSGWGLALWRSSHNIVSRNAFDFCIRGYSHGVYNRGQDSAGILVFEQCSKNDFLENSATHGGDGFFAFAGKEALGEAQPADGRELNLERLGNNDNVLLGNDFSFAAAHGIECTFSFGNKLVRNRLTYNAICGVWGGYSSHTLIADNIFEYNGDAGYGLERGGINIEHGSANRILDNGFKRNVCGVHLWWDEDAHLANTPWAQANGVACADNVVAGNSFYGDELAVHLRQAENTLLGDNRMRSVERELDRDESSTTSQAPQDLVTWKIPKVEVHGENRPVGARSHLRGRDKIVLTEWGPYDGETPFLQRIADRDGAHVYRLLGPAELLDAEAGDHLRVRLVDSVRPPEVHVSVEEAGGILPYRLRVYTSEADLEAAAVLASAAWKVKVFAWTKDPREDEAGWRTESYDFVSFDVPVLDLAYAMGGPSELEVASDVVLDAALPSDHFGTIAETTLSVPAGTWKVRTVSDDGIRLWIDGKLLIDDWTWHAPTVHEAHFSVSIQKTVTVRVEHFELDGLAVLEVGFDRAEG